MACVINIVHGQSKLAHGRCINVAEAMQRVLRRRRGS